MKRALKVWETLILIVLLAISLTGCLPWFVDEGPQPDNEEGETPYRSHFPDNVEDYSPLPIPEVSDDEFENTDPIPDGGTVTHISSLTAESTIYIQDKEGQLEKRMYPKNTLNLFDQGNGWPPGWLRLKTLVPWAR